MKKIRGMNKLSRWQSFDCMQYLEMCIENFTCCREKFVKIVICLLRSDFVLLENILQTSLQQSNFDACKILHAS